MFLPALTGDPEIRFGHRSATGRTWSHLPPLRFHRRGYRDRASLVAAARKVDSELDFLPSESDRGGLTNTRNRNAALGYTHAPLGEVVSS